MELLPYNCWFDIFSFLNSRESLVFIRISKPFNRTFDSDSSWKDKYIRKFGYLPYSVDEYWNEKLFIGYHFSRWKKQYLGAGLPYWIVGDFIGLLPTEQNLFSIGSSSYVEKFVSITTKDGISRFEETLEIYEPTQGEQFEVIGLMPPSIGIVAITPDLANTSEMETLVDQMKYSHINGGVLYLIDVNGKLWVSKRRKPNEFTNPLNFPILKIVTTLVDALVIDENGEAILIEFPEWEWESALSAIEITDHELRDLDISEEDIDPAPYFQMRRLGIKAKDIAVGNDNYLILDYNNQVWSFGISCEGSLGIKGCEENEWYDPILMPNVKASKIETLYGRSISLIVDTNGRVRIFGQYYFNQQGILGRLGTSNEYVVIFEEPTLIPNIVCRDAKLVTIYLEKECRHECVVLFISD